MIFFNSGERKNGWVGRQTNLVLMRCEISVQENETEVGL